MPTMLIVGADSLIGAALSRTAIARGWTVWETTRRANTTTARRRFLDLAADVETWPLPDEPIDAAVFCGAVTSTIVCEADPTAAHAVNVRGTVTLARRLAAAHTFVLLLSTNHVFDGREADVSADAAACPRTEYGRQKTDAEAAFCALQSEAAILRLSKVVAGTLGVFEQWRETLARGGVARPFDDMVIAPVPIETVIDAVLRIVETRSSGIMQLSADRDIAYAEVAARLAAAMGASAEQVVPVPSREHSTAFAPRHTTLDSSRLERELRIRRPNTDDVIERCITATLRPPEA